tara:strand:- start:13201 stop:13638 length:438 start_codon:yes stop_codon:yes gene_type:complete
MNYQAIRDEIDGDPATYDNKTNGEISDIFNARNIIGPLNTRQLLEWSAGNGRAAKIRALADDTTATDADRSLGLAADTMMRRADAELRPGDPAHVALITGLKDAGAINGADVTSLAALAANQITRGEQLGLGTVRKGHVRKAKVL